MPQPLPTPPWRARAVVHAVLPDDPMRDAIVGDLHEEFVSDAARLGPAEARVRYHRRAAGIVVHAAVDFLRGRRWASAALPAEASRATAPARARGAGRAGRADVGVGALALGVLLAGIVVNTLLFSAVRHAPPRAAGSMAVSSAVGVGAAALALACAAVAAVMVCAGPRWLRRRLHRRARPTA